MRVNINGADHQVEFLNARIRAARRRGWWLLVAGSAIGGFVGVGLGWLIIALVEWWP